MPMVHLADKNLGYLLQIASFRVQLDLIQSQGQQQQDLNTITCFKGY